MKDYLSITNRLIVTALFTAYVWSLILWDYMHDGVPVHYILHSDDMPGISNWWGALIIPVLVWFVLRLISKRNDQVTDKASVKTSTLRLLLAVLFGTVISVLFSSESNAIDYLMLGLFAASFFFKLYRSEFFLGFVMSTLLVFGAAIPAIGGVILVGILFIFYKIGRLIAALLQPKQSI